MYQSPTKGRVSLEGVVKEISAFIDEDPDRFYKVVIGSDSQGRRVSGKEVVDFVTAIIIHRQGVGARYFWRKERVNQKPVLRDKIYTETTMSLTTAGEFVPVLRQKISSKKYDFEIHIDVGPLGPTREMIKEVVGMVQGNGFKARTKPESWGASSVADKHT